MLEPGMQDYSGSDEERDRRRDDDDETIEQVRATHGRIGRDLQHC